MRRGVGKQSGRIPFNRPPSKSDLVANAVDPRGGPPPRMYVPPPSYMQPAPLPEHSAAPLNESKAAACYRKAAELGSAQAQYNLGVSFFTGSGVEKSAAPAVEYYQQAAGQGHADASNALGYCHRYGVGTATDLVRAARCYRMAAQLGHAEAQFSLGLCCRDGLGVAVDPQAGESWVRKAAAQGHAEAVAFVDRFFSDKFGGVRTPWAVAADQERVTARRAMEEQAFPQAPPPRNSAEWDPSEQAPRRDFKPADRFNLCVPEQTHAEPTWTVPSVLHREAPKLASQ